MFKTVYIFFNKARPTTISNRSSIVGYDCHQITTSFCLVGLNINFVQVV